MTRFAAVWIGVLAFAAGGVLVLSWQRSAARSHADAARLAMVHAQAAAAGELASARAVLATVSAHAEGLEAALRDARHDLVVERDRRIERERQFLAFQRGVGSLGSSAAFGPGSAFDEALREALDLPPPEGSARSIADEEAAARDAEERASAEAALREDAASRAQRFNVMLRLGGVHGIDLFEAGARRERGWGPVVFRTLDGDGRLTGHLAADSLHLVGSRFGRTLELVLIDGHTASGAERRPFPGGELRLTLRHVDPAPFAEAFGELFDGGELAQAADDGLWPLSLVRLRLNQMLAEHADAGRHHLAFLGGVSGDELVDVEFEVRDAQGRLERLLFADRAALSIDGRTLVLELRNGTSQRGDRRTPFLDGRLRIVLPRVDAERWRAAGLPGLGVPPLPVAGG